MFGFLKKKKSSQEAMGAYIMHTASVTDDTYTFFLETFIQFASDLGDVPSELLVEKLKSVNPKWVYFSSLFALGALAIDNCFDEQEAILLKNQIKGCLERLEDGGEGVADKVVILMKSATQKLEEGSALPHESIATDILHYFRLNEYEETKGLLENNLFINFIALSIVEPGSGWWKAASKQAKIVS